MGSRLSEQYYPLVRKLAHAIGRGKGMSIDDLIGVGSIAIVEAERHYNPDKGSFVHYATMYIVSRICSAMGKSDLIVPVHESYRLRKLRGKLGKARLDLGHDVSLEAVLDQVGMTREEYENYRKDASVKALPFDDVIKKKNDLEKRNPMDYLAREIRTPFDDCVVSERKKIVSDAIDALPGACSSGDRISEMMRLYWFEDMTLEEIGESYGITRERTRQLMNRGLNTLKKILGAKLGRIICGNNENIKLRYFNYNQHKKSESGSKE